MNMFNYVRYLIITFILLLLSPPEISAHNLVDSPYFVLSNYSGRARISYADGQPAGPEIHGQLYFGLLGDPVDSFTPLFPITSISSEPGFEGYLKGVLVSMPVDGYGFGDRETISVQVRAFDGESWESSLIRGESMPLDRKLKDGTHGPNNLLGLQPFSVHTVPEPSTWSLLIVGVVATVTMTCRSRGSAGRRPG